MIHSFFKSFKAIRYHDRENIGKFLTDLVIKKIEDKKNDENLISYAINRLALYGDVENMKRLNTAIVEGGLIPSIERLQNIVMYLHALAIHK